MNRSSDWGAQAQCDLRHARHSIEAGDYDWAAFAAQQAAEKAVKAVILAQGGEPWGHLVSGLLEALPAAVKLPPDILDAGKRLDKHYIPARYPNGFDAGYPGKLYTASEAEGAIADAERITAFCRGHLPG